MKRKIIFIDFDGTIVEDVGNYPYFGNFLPYAKQVLQKLQELHYVVIYTLRDESKTRISDKLLLALNFLKDNGITKIFTPHDVPFHGFKPPYDFLIDDRATLDGKIDWLEIAKKFEINLESNQEL